MTTLLEGAANATAEIAKLREDKAELLNALEGLTGIIKKAGLIHLADGVQLGPTVWYVHASDSMEFADAVIAKHTAAGAGS